jgi:hypothetical protein
LSVTSNEDPDMAAAAINGVTIPVIAIDRTPPIPA